MFFPIAGATPPKHLDGSLAGDYGFDPLRLGTKPELLKYFQVGEIINARWAMLAVVGILAQEALGRGDWWTAGAKEYPVDLQTQLIVGIPTFAVLEALRVRGLQSTGDIKFLDPMKELNPMHCFKLKSQGFMESQSRQLNPSVKQFYRNRRI